MSRDKIHILQFPQRPRPSERPRAWRVPADVLFLLGLAVAFVLAHYSDKPPLVEKPITIQRAEGPYVADSAGYGVRVIDTGLRGYER